MDPRRSSQGGVIVTDTTEEWSGAGDMLATACALLFAGIGLTYAVAGADIGIRIHGLMLLAASAYACFYVLSNPTNLRAEKASGYFDGPVRVATVACVFWGVVGFFVGTIIALQLAF